MSKADLGWTIAYIGPKKVEFPPYMNKTVEGINKSKLKDKISKLMKENPSNVLSIPAEDGVLEKKEKDGAERK